MVIERIWPRVPRQDESSLSPLQPIRSSAPDTSGVRALFLYHASLLAFWAYVQVHYRVMPSSVLATSKLSLGLASLALIVVALVVISRFALAHGGTPVAGIARVAMVLAAIDVIGESLQLAPELGLPALMPSGRDLTELVVRSVWVSCEFAMRIAVFVSLWRLQTGADRRIRAVFFGLVLVHWGIALISFARGTDAYAAFWNAYPITQKLPRAGPWLAMTWMSIMVWLNYRVSSARNPAA